VLKEHGGKGRVVVTGIRAEESTKRKHRKLFLIEKRKTILNPILDWTLLDVWDFIDSNKFPYCSLYDTHFDRLGCIGCPLSSNQRREFLLYPKFKEAWHRAALRYFDAQGKGVQRFSSGEDFWQWWLSGKSIKIYQQQNQGTMELGL